MAVSTGIAKNGAKHGNRPLPDAVSKRQSELASLIGRNIDADGMRATAIPRLFLMRASQLTEPLSSVYEPALCIVAQGRKQVVLADEVYFYNVW
jgi:AraC-type transcriptional regulator N-terminus